MGRMNKTAHYGGYSGIVPYKVRDLSRSFDTLEAAQKFVEGKNVFDICKSHGRFKVIWYKTATINEYGTEMGGQHMTRAKETVIKEELKWESEMYQQCRNAGDDKHAERHWHTIKGMQKVLTMLGYDTECDPETFEWTITNREEKGC